MPTVLCRRFSPSFRVRVDVQFRERVQLPVTVRAFVVSQHEKDTILGWMPIGEQLAPEVRVRTHSKGHGSDILCSDGNISCRELRHRWVTPNKVCRTGARYARALLYTETLQFLSCSHRVGLAWLVVLCSGDQSHACTCISVLAQSAHHLMS